MRHELLVTAGRAEWLPALGWMAAFFLMLWLLGALLTVPLFTLVYLLAASRESPVLAGACAARVVGVRLRTVRSDPAHTVAMKHPVTVRVNGQSYSEEVEARTLLVHFLRERARPDRHARRLRRRRMRRLLGARGRCARQVVPDARRPGQQTRGDDGRGPGTGGPAAPGAGGVRQELCAAVRLLHARVS